MSNQNKKLIKKIKNQSIYFDIKNVLQKARKAAYKAVNFAMVQAYWHIGKLIVEEEQKGRNRAEYGQKLINDLSQKLTADFGKGFDPSNLRYIRLFYKKFPICDALSHKLSWTHYRLLLKVEKENVRDFYIKECVSENWSTRQLERQINSFFYERLLSSKDKKLVKSEIHEKEDDFSTNDIIKDPYVLEFLNVREGFNLREDELEKLLINKLQDFLLELGKGFCFVDRQKRITLDGDHFFIDLVFYNNILKCFVLIELKIGKLSHKDIGQMDFYVRYFEKEVRQEDDNPTIGILLCADKNKAMVKYSLLDESKNIFASKYKLHLPTEEELKKEIIRERDLIEQEKKLKRKR